MSGLDPDSNAPNAYPWVVTATNALSERDAAEARHLLRPLSAEPANVVSDEQLVVERSVRFAKVRAIPRRLGWLYRRLEGLVTEWNHRVYGLGPLTFTEPLVHIEYPLHGHYRWHTDASPGSPARKLSVTVQLTDGKCYQGGDLEIERFGNLMRAPRLLGSLTIFPSSTRHRVTAIRFGRREALVGWLGESGTSETSPQSK